MANRLQNIEALLAAIDRGIDEANNLSRFDERLTRLTQDKIELLDSILNIEIGEE